MPFAARMHDLTADYDLTPEQQDDPWRSVHHLLQELHRHAEALRSQAEQEGHDICAALVLTEHILGRLAACDFDAVPRQLTHGDFQGHNLLFQDDSLVGVIDFENLEYRPRLYDLAWPFVFWRCFGTRMGAYTEQDWDYVRSCCQAYAASATSLVEVDKSMLPMLMAYIPVRGIVDAINEDEPVGEILAFSKAIDLAAWLVDHPDEAYRRMWGYRRPQ